MMTFSPPEINAYLDRLTEGWDKEAAQSVVTAFHDLPLPSSRTVIHKAEMLEGFTQEAGNVSPRDREVKHTTKGENAEEYKRVGFYKIKRTGREGAEVAMVTFCHFWKADFSTGGPEVPEPYFGVEYFTETLEPYALVVFETIEEEPPLLFKVSSMLRDLRVHFFAALKGRTVKISSVFYKSCGRTLYGISRMGHSA